MLENGWCPGHNRDSAALQETNHSLAKELEDAWSTLLNHVNFTSEKERDEARSMLLQDVQDQADAASGDAAGDDQLGDGDATGEGLPVNEQRLILSERLSAKEASKKSMEESVSQKFCS